MTKLFSVLTSLLFSLLAFSQTSSIKMPKSSFESQSYLTASEGFRVTVFKQNYELKSTLKTIEANSSTFDSSNNSLDLDYGNGLSVGYAYLPIRTLGFITSFNYIQLISRDYSTNTVRLDGNATYAFNRNFYSKLGLNYSRWVGKNPAGIDPEIGYQFGAGIQITRAAGIELAFTQSNFSTDSEQSSVQYKQNFSIEGLEFGLTGTF